MKSAALHRLESLLQTRNLAGTLAPAWDKARVAVSSSGIAELDEQLGGGWRQGEVSEVIGTRSTGRTSVLVATLAAAAAGGAVVALVDAIDRFDPVSAASAGLDLSRLLWVRGPGVTAEMARPALIDEAVHRGVRACDLIVRAGGFAVVALDLADVPPRYVRALPLATWWRLAHANAGRPTACLLMGDTPMGRSARGASVCVSGQAIWAGESAQSRRFRGFQISPQSVVHRSQGFVHGAKDCGPRTAG